MPDYDDGAYPLTLTEDPATSILSGDLQPVLEDFLVEGDYNVGVAALDDAGNYSDMLVLQNVPFNFEAPTLTGALEIS
jgi:hypothetical protein